MPQDAIDPGQEVVITNPNHRMYNEWGEYAGLADTVPGLKPRHRISFDGDIFLANREDFKLV
ncbi:hypothetical protein [Eoetvoesiella caeni]|uniref:Uncharacterized protein n=1 Tax=Eoetvoesiella caeni TaxID=645616 RepID=A0A366GZR3_9BURK|nr:hypothetical protein [Eoetvoesiella caeni]MCI2811286.1 hypothetical protein [Eoetvoesiella caeni]NYT57240.1 hypothetical protein [Eoetvoesiella caeni]RBP33613.1 hypothetical protein DFR37_1264 [Eoetvoesiella caeni]